MRIAIRPLASALLVAGAIACGGDEPIRIGLAGPVAQPRGKSMAQGAQLAIDELNRAGGVRGRRLELVIKDDGGENQKAIAVADSFIAARDIVAVIGHLNSGPTVVAGLRYNSGDDPLVAISPSASSVQVTGVGPWMYRVCPTDDAHGGAIARYLVRTLNARRVTVIYLNDVYGRGVFNAFRSEYERQDGTSLLSYPVLPGADPAIYAEHVAQFSYAQAIVLATDRATALPLVRALRARGVTAPIFGGDGLIGIEAEGAIAEGLYISASYLAQRPGESNAAFVSAYAAAFDGAVPDHRSAGAYDVVRLLARVIGEVGTDRDRIRAALDRVQGEAAFEGVTGAIKFDRNGDAEAKPVLIGVINGGRLQYAQGQ